MSYGHQWTIREELPPEQWRAFRDDCARLFTLAAAQGLELAGENGHGKPSATLRAVRLNGRADCGHPRRELGHPWPEPDAHGVVVAFERGEPYTDKTLTYQGLLNPNGVTYAQDSDIAGMYAGGCRVTGRTCGGDCSAEPLIIKQSYKGDTTRTRVYITAISQGYNGNSISKHEIKWKNDGRTSQNMDTAPRTNTEGNANTPHQQEQIRQQDRESNDVKPSRTQQNGFEMVEENKRAVVEGVPNVSESVKRNRILHSEQDEQNERLQKMPTSYEKQTTQKRNAEKEISRNWRQDESVPARMVEETRKGPSFETEQGETKRSESKKQGEEKKECWIIDRVCSDFRPYDIVVTAVLLLARQHFGALIQIETDGTPQQWTDGQLLITELQQQGGPNT